jgi:RNA polymerase sigma-70 factor, ECF subfamily
MRTDEELMAAHIAGDGAAFRELFDRYAPILLGVLRRSLPRPDDARDLLQLTFLHVHRARADYRPGAPFRPWLFTIALNLRREHFRRVARRPEEPLDEESAAAVPPSDPTDAARVHAALSVLPESQREVIVLHWFAGLSFPEVASVVGASVPAVKVRAHRGYERLRAILGASEVTAAPVAPYVVKDSK